jgi:hypothetical protein
MTFADNLAALPTRSEWQAGLDSIRADLRDIKRALAPRKVKPRPVRVSAGPRLRAGRG